MFVRGSALLGGPLVTVGLQVGEPLEFGVWNHVVPEAVLPQTSATAIPFPVNGRYEVGQIRQDRDTRSVTALFTS
jgi:hypothetical protein